ncbi:hypothetical protein [Uliginosibacterium gangwonense]|uniref:hypothetical protein n=1 Tax=Uliginosibacterium gangwonense TaxID=392736 RepID=UPI0003A1B696|nr:hypothetical protein [Uliginosibacterium gangwonense]
MRTLLLGLSLLLLMVSPCGRAGTPTPTISIIVATGASHPGLKHEEIALIFARKRRFWDDGSRIQAVNLPANNPLRRSFSQQIFSRTPEELEDYWRSMYFHGDLPPYVLASEEAVIRFVATTPGAIGYVSHCVVDARVSVLMQLDGSSTCTH